MQLFDIGVNLTSDQFAGQHSEIISRAKQSGIKNMLLIGSDIDDSTDAIKLATEYNLIASAGVHPHQAKSVNDITQLQAQLTDFVHQHSCVKVIGECGLDYNRDFSPRPQQRDVFAAQVALANTLQLPLYMHERDAHDDFYQIAKESHGKGVVHCFTGSKEALKRYLDLGFYIGITGWVCDERRGAQLQQLVPYVPSDRLLLETDAPYLLPRTIVPKPKSRRNEPAFLCYVVKEVAKLLKRSEQEVATLSYQNALTLFNLTE